MGVLAVYLTLLAAALGVRAELTADYYSETCPLALTTIKVLVGAAIVREPRMGASLVRLHFHDCFVNVSFFYLADQATPPPPPPPPCKPAM
jgi:peroxidase